MILFFCAPLIAQFYDKPELIGLSRIVFLSFLFGGFGIASNAYMFKTLMVKERAKIDIISLICSGTIGVLLALNGFAYYGLAIQTTAYIGIGSMLKFCYSPWTPTFLIDWRPLKSMFRFSSKLIVTNVFTQISNNIFSVILGKFYSPRQLGFYSQGQKWMGMGNSFVGGMINGVAQPVLVQSVADKDRQRNMFIVCFSYFGIYFMVVGFVIANVIGLLLWHIIINRVVSINLFSVIKDIIPYFVSILVSIIVCHYVLFFMENIFLLFTLKILIVSVLYMAIMNYGNSIIFKECISFLLKK